MTDLADYDNLIGRPTGPYMRLGSKLLKGVRAVQDQIKPYAEAWQVSNVREFKSGRRKPIWVVLGDSMAQGVGASAYDRGWPGYLRILMGAAGKEYRLINLSISGARIEDVLERQLPAMENLGVKPTLVTMLIGSNNMPRKKYRQGAAASYAHLLARMPEGSVIANLPGTRALAVSIDRQLRAQAAVGKIILVDIRRHGPRDWRGKLSPDHFHPNDKGYEGLARVFARSMGISTKSPRPGLKLRRLGAMTKRS